MKRLDKYRSDLHAHLDNVNRKLDDEIYTMRQKIKSTKEDLSTKTRSIEEMETKIGHMTKEVKQKEKILDSKKKDFEKLSEQQEEKCDGNSAEKEGLMKLRQKLTELEYELNEASANLTNTQKEVKDQQLALENIGSKQDFGRNTRELENLKRLKRTQDSAIHRLQMDIEATEKSLDKVNSSMEGEITKRLHTAQDVDNLRVEVGSYEKEKVQVPDEFKSLMENLKDKELRINKQDEGSARQVEKLKGLLSNYEEYIQDLDKNISESEKVVAKQSNDVKNLQLSNKGRIKNLLALHKTYEELKNEKGVEEEFQSDSSNDDFDEFLYETQKEQESLADEVLSKKASLIPSTRGSDSQSKSPRKKRMTPDSKLDSIKETYLKYKRQQKALEHRIRKVSEKNNLLKEKLEEETKTVEKNAETLQNCEEQRNSIIHDIAKLEPETLDHEQFSEKSENARKVAHLSEILRKMEVQNGQLKGVIDNNKKELETMTIQLKTLGEIDMEAVLREREASKVNLRRMKNQSADLRKQARNLERALELCIVQRDSTVNKAQSVVHLNTTIRAEREQEIANIKQRIAEKRQRLHSSLTD